MDPVAALVRLGGVATYRDLSALCSRGDIEAALCVGDVLRDARGRYALPAADQARRAANAVSGVVSHLSAALLWGWEVKTVPARPHVTVRRSRRATPRLLASCAPHWATLDAAEVVDGVTSPLRTLADCLRSLPADEALCVADSALRHEAVTAPELRALADVLRGPGTPQARRVAVLADGRAANPFESVLR